MSRVQQLRYQQIDFRWIKDIVWQLIWDLASTTILTNCLTIRVLYTEFGVNLYA